jgi:hypothetical protein
MSVLRRHSSVLAVALFMGCSSAAEPELLAPDAVSVAWAESYNESGDGLGALVPIDVMVYDGASGQPLAGVSLQLSTEHDGTWILPADAVVRGVHRADDVSSATGPSSELVWDARHDRYLELGVDSSRLAAGSATFATGPDGVVRAQVFVDHFPATPGTRADWVLGGGAGRAFQDVAVVISGANPEDPLVGTVLLQPR